MLVGYLNRLSQQLIHISWIPTSQLIIYRALDELVQTRKGRCHNKMQRKCNVSTVNAFQVQNRQYCNPLKTQNSLLFNKLKPHEVII